MKLKIFKRKASLKIKKYIDNIKFRIEAFSLGKIIILSGLILGIISLFLNFINSDNHLLNSNIFGKVTIFSGIVISLIYFIIFFLLFSFTKKELIKKQTSVLLRDYILITYMSIILFILCLNLFFTIKGLSIFTSEVFVGKGIIMLFISTIIIFSGSFVLKNEYNSKIILLDESGENKGKNTPLNTKLPF